MLTTQKIMFFHLTVFLFFVFSLQYTAHIQKTKINIVKLSLFTTGCTEEVRKDLRKKRRKEVTVSLPYICREHKALARPFGCVVAENRNQLCALVVVSSRFFSSHYFPSPKNQ